jgi:hypothetical protein
MIIVPRGIVWTAICGTHLRLTVHRTSFVKPDAERYSL